MSATNDEIERYARAVLAGRRDVAAPGTLGERRVRVQFDDGSSSFGYREPRLPARKLWIQLGFLSRVNLWILPVALAACAGIAHAWWLRRAADPSLWLAAITLFVAVLALRRVLALFDRFEVRVADGVLRTRDSLFWPRLLRGAGYAEIGTPHVKEQAAYLRAEDISRATLKGVSTGPN